MEHINDLAYYYYWGAVVIVWELDLQLPVQSVPITTKVVNLNLPSWRDVLDKVCQWYSGFLINKTDHHDITEILLKVALV
jgi:hypothetical protein